MVKRKLLLKESELLKLINQTTNRVSEQVMVPTDLEGGGGGVTYYDSHGDRITNPNYYRIKQKEIDDKLGKQMGTWMREDADRICDKFLTGKKLTDSEVGKFQRDGYIKELVMDCLEESEQDLDDNWFDYHFVLDIISILLYVIGGIGSALSWTGAGAVIAAVAFWLALVIEFGNGLSYILVDDEPNYFLAGMTWCFMAMPVFQLAKGPIKGITKSLSTSFRIGGLSSLTKSFQKLSTAKKLILQNFLKEFPGLELAAKTGLKKVNKAIKEIDKGINVIKNYWGMGWTIRQLKWIVSFILKPIKFGCTLITQIAVVLAAYDPAMVGGVFNFLGNKFNSDNFSSFGDFLNQLSADNIGGYSLFKELLRKFGDPKGVITTTKMNCGEEYQWLQVKKAFYKESPDNFEGLSDPTLEESIWENWKKGWRPGYNLYWDSEDITNTKNALSNRRDIQVEMALRTLDSYSLILNYKNEVIEIEGKEEWANIVKWLECSKFIEGDTHYNDDFQLTLHVIEDLLEELQIK
tara:strand:- start:2875 stop:4437 length:1563 start_codon:yes stop_codon:yes gene_type:complete